jgi:glutamyl-tRNA synthetase
MVKHFALERVGKPAAIFDQEKLRWMNGVYIRQLSTVDLTARLRPFLERDLPKKLLPVDERYLLQIVPLIHERIKLLSEVADLTRYFFDLDLDCDPTALIQRGMDRESTIKALQHAFTKLDAAPKFEHNDLEALLRATASNLAFSPRQFFGTLRQASTGRSTSPPLFETLEVLGRERVLPRIQSAIKLLVDG